MFFRLFLLMRKEFLQFFRNVPLLAILLFCITIDVYMAGSLSMDIHDYPMAIYDLDHTEQSREIISKMREPYFHVSRVLTQEKEVTDLIESGEVSVVMVVPHDFGKKLSRYQTAEMQVILDGSNSNASELALGYIQRIVDRHNIDILFKKWNVSKITKDMVPYVDSAVRYLYNPNLMERWTFGIQEFFIDLTLLGILLIATTMVNEKQFGTIEQLMVTPLTTFEILISKIVPMVVILMVASFIAVFAVLKPLMGIPIKGNIFSFFFVTLIYIVTIAGLGLVISTISSRLSDTVLFSVLILVPIMFLSGAWVPLESMPGWMRFMVHFSPLKYYLDLGNGIFLKGNSLGFMWRELLCLSGLGVAAFCVGVLRFRKVFR